MSDRRPTAEELGRMTVVQLRAIKRCELCLERYAACGCRLNLPRRRDAEARLSAADAPQTTGDDKVSERSTRERTH